MTTRARLSVASASVACLLGSPGLARVPELPNVFKGTAKVGGAVVTTGTVSFVLTGQPCRVRRDAPIRCICGAFPAGPHLAGIYSTPSVEL
jgi:hypothetical protein